MTTITIQLPDEIFQNLQQMAEQYEVSTQELAQASIEQLLATPEHSLDEALDYVLHKNRELYQRLA